MARKTYTLVVDIDGGPAAENWLIAALVAQAEEAPRDEDLPPGTAWSLVAFDDRPSAVIDADVDPD
jgi:hypothetical protein